MANFAKVLKVAASNLDYIILGVLSFAVTFISADYYPEDKIVPGIAALAVTIFASLYFDKVKYGWVDS